MKARLKITDAMVDAAMDALLDHAKKTGTLPADATHDDVADYATARVSVRVILRAGVDACLTRSGYGGAL